MHRGCGPEWGFAIEGPSRRLRCDIDWGEWTVRTVTESKLENQLEGVIEVEREPPSPLCGGVFEALEPKPI